MPKSDFQSQCQESIQKHIFCYWHFLQLFSETFYFLKWCPTFDGSAIGLYRYIQSFPLCATSLENLTTHIIIIIKKRNCWKWFCCRHVIISRIWFTVATWYAAILQLYAQNCRRNAKVSWVSICIYRFFSRSVDTKT
jgi:hypothetical protein